MRFRKTRKTKKQKRIFGKPRTLSFRRILEDGIADSVATDVIVAYALFLRLYGLYTRTIRYNLWTE